jgi:hypothetical protein
MSTISRIVDVFIADRWVAAYPVSWTLLSEPIIEQDAVELARHAMKDDGFSADQIGSARYVVRRP